MTLILFEFLPCSVTDDTPSNVKQRFKSLICGGLKEWFNPCVFTTTIKINVDMSLIIMLRMHFNFHRTIFWTQLSFLVWTFPIFWALLWAATCSRSTCLLTTGPLEKTLWRETLFRRWNQSFPAPAWSSSACRTTRARSPKIESARKAHTQRVLWTSRFFLSGWLRCKV